jgi:hypothetical protein
MEPKKVLDHLDVTRHLLTLPVHGMFDLHPTVLIWLVFLSWSLALADLGLLVRERRWVVRTRGKRLLVRYPDVLADEHVAAVLLLVQEVLAAAHVHDQEQCCFDWPTLHQQQTHCLF